MPETMGGGVGVIDFDLNGQPDLCFSQGGQFDPPDNQLNIELYRQQSELRFVRCSAAAGMTHIGYGQGVAVGDYNSDGFDDIYLTCLERNALFTNQGDGTFVDSTSRCFDAIEDRWSTTAAWADLSGDGLTDLYVCTYLQLPIRPFRPCLDAKGEPRICLPKEFDAWQDYCFINDGTGRFIDETTQRGLIAPQGKGLSVAIADFDDDRLPDIYVANDTTANFYFRGQPNGQFVEEGMLRGCATDGQGLMQASMGLAVADYDRNGLLDIYSTHYYNESNTLYRNLGPSGFQDVTARVRLHAPTLKSLAFGTCWVDLDHDGWDELLVVNGHVDNHPRNPLLKMPPQLFRYLDDHYQEISSESGEFFRVPRVGRGVATVDLENDGDIDLVTVPERDPVSVLVNQNKQGHWLQLRCIGTRSERTGVGVKVTLKSSSLTLTKQIVGGTSYLSTPERLLHFGLASDATPVTLQITWPSGQSQTITDVAVDQRIDVIEPLDDPSG